MNDDLEIYMRLFLVAPLLAYTGYCIMKRQTHTSTVMFHTMVVLLIALTLFFHLKYLVRVVRRIFRKEKYQKDFGIFLLVLAVFVAVMCASDLYFQKKR